MNMPRATKKINNLSEDSKLTVNYALGFALQRPKETALCNSRSRKRLQMTTVGFFVKGLLLSPEISMCVCHYQKQGYKQDTKAPSPPHAGFITGSLGQQLTLTECLCEMGLISGSK